MFYLIYKTINKINGKFYIGKHQTNDMNDGYMGSGKLLRRAIHKHGLKNFVKEILFVFDNEQDMNSKEAELVTEEFCARSDNYNICPGGKGGWGYVNQNGLGVSDNQKAAAVLVAKRNIPLMNDASMRWAKIKGGKNSRMGDRQNQIWIGRTHSQETRLKQRASALGKHKGRKNSQYGTCWITNGIVNRKCTKQDFPEWENKGFRMGRIAK